MKSCTVDLCPIVVGLCKMEAIQRANSDLWRRVSCTGWLTRLPRSCIVAVSLGKSDPTDGGIDGSSGLAAFVPCV